MAGRAPIRHFQLANSAMTRDSPTTTRAIRS
jgi:hypothetical protein